MARTTPVQEHRVLAQINGPEMVELLQSLVRIPSLTFHEEEICSFFARWLSQQGFSVTQQPVTPGRTNVIATLEGQLPGPTLAFNGHMDVVPAGDGWSVEPFGGEIRQGRLYGRGATDMKGGLAAAVAAMLTVKRSRCPLQGRVVLTAVVDEEETQSGTRTLVESGFKADWAVVCEPTDLRLVTAHKGLAALEIATRGIAAHASIPERGDSALTKTRKLLDRLDGYSEALRHKQHAMVGQPTLTVGTINGGTASCVVPAACTIGIDRRMIPGETGAQVLAELRSLIDASGVLPPPEIKVVVMAQPLEEPLDSPLVRALGAAVNRQGLVPTPTGWPAVSDAHLLANDGGIPTVLFGPGELAVQAHAADESISIQHLNQAAQVYVRLILELLEGGNPA